jgi:transposase InsO family protein
MAKKKYRRYSPEFKRHALKRASEDGVYGAPKVTAELKEEGHQCGRHKVARLMRTASLKYSRIADIPGAAPR